MTQNEFKTLWRNEIVLKGEHLFIILDFNEEEENCQGLTLKNDERSTIVFEDGVTASDLDFFDINEETFLADCVKYNQPINDVCLGKIDNRSCNEYTIHNAVDAVCKDGLVKHFSLNNIGIFFLKRVIKQYKS